MATYSRERRDSLRSHGRRDSLSHSMTRQRPRLLRSSATEPSITASNAIRGHLSCSSSPQKATDLLSRVAVYSPPTSELERPSTPDRVSQQVEAIAICRDSHEQSPTGSQDVVLVDSPSEGYYFSFPSFDNWNRDKQEPDKDTDD